MTMTAAAFRATYSDFKLIKTRGVVSISFEVPLGEVLGGMPDPGAEGWCAIARLEDRAFAGLGQKRLSAQADSAAESPGSSGAPNSDRADKPRKPVAADKRLAQQAGILCSDPVFRAFLNEEGPIGIGPITDEEAAALAVRELCGVLSRADLVPGSSAAERWNDLHGRFLAWKLVA